MIVGDSPQWPLVEILLCAADVARQGYAVPITEVTIRMGIDPTGTIAVEARDEARAVAPHVFDYSNELLAETLLEAAYRVAAGHGAGGVL